MINEERSRGRYLPFQIIYY